jgi:hypothetical protein
MGALTTGLRRTQARAIWAIGTPCCSATRLPSRPRRASGGQRRPALPTAFSRSSTPSQTPPPGSATPGTTCNRLARALYAPVLAGARRSANNARFVYLDPAARDFFADWERAADDIAAMLRSDAGSNPHDKQLIELIGELSTHSEDFRIRWAAHSVRFHRTGHKRIRHPVVGVLDLSFEAMEFPAHPGLTLLVYTAAGGSLLPPTA